MTGLGPSPSASRVYAIAKRTPPILAASGSRRRMATTSCQNSFSV
ncbi:hypothetical protein ACVWZV_009348 [Bradyrhizobium sp. GM5.1]